jgi:phosphoglycolate phosphatase
VSPLPTPRALLFDWDNTLVDNWPAIHQALNATFQAMGHDLWTLKETKARVRKSLRDSFPEMFGDRWEDARKVFYDTFAEVHLTHLHPLPGTGEGLAVLAESGMPLAVVSNKNGTYLRAEADALGWRGHFINIVGATDAAADKPAPEPVHMALSNSGLIPGPDIWFIGDGAIDVECAKAAGLTPIVLESPEIRAELSCHNLDQFIGDDNFVADLSGLLALLGLETPVSARSKKETPGS